MTSNMSDDKIKVKGVMKSCSPNNACLFDDPCDLRMRVRPGHVSRLLDLFEPRGGQTTLRQGYPGAPSQIGHLGSHDPAALVTYGKRVQTGLLKGKGSETAFRVKL